MKNIFFDSMGFKDDGFRNDHPLGLFCIQIHTCSYFEILDTSLYESSINHYDVITIIYQ